MGINRLRQPLCIDLFCGLGGWSAGFLAAGYDCVGFDIERHAYGKESYPAQLVLQDVLTLHGSQFRDAAVIVASPPCQRYSYMAMPFSRGKMQAAEIRADATGEKLQELNALFDACFKIQHQAEAAAGHHIPLIVENVKGCQPWTRRANWHFGSFYLWGNVPALMPITFSLKRPNRNFHAHENGLGSSPSFNGAEHETRGVKGAEPIGQDVPADGTGKTSWFFGARADPRDMRKNENGEYSRFGKNEAVKVSGDWFGNYAEMKAAGTISPTRITSSKPSGVKQTGLSGPAWFDNGNAHLSSRSNARKAASAQIAKIPFELSHYIATVYKPSERKVIQTPLSRDTMIHN